ncbi:MAG: lipocalin family protein [Desulfomonilaceae bacterium]
MKKTYFPILSAMLVVTAFLAVGCQKETALPERDPNAAKLAGVWMLTARVADDHEQPAEQRILKLTFTDRGAFQAEYRGDPQQKWIQPGKGVFTFAPPLLTLYWDSGAVTTLSVQQLTPDRIVLHHGRNLVPLKDQEPDEIYQRQSIAKGPTKSSNQ